MISHPTADQIARAVAAWIDEIRPQLDQRNVFLARVAINALGIVERELKERATHEAAMVPKLATLLGKEGSYGSLIHDACEALRNGNINAETPGLLATLREDTLAKLAIDQPTYRHERST